MANGEQIQEAAVVEARPGVEMVEAEAVETEAPAGGAEIPDEVLQIPAMQGLVAGQPGAFSALVEDFEKKPEGKVLAANVKPLQEAGFGLYRSLDGSKGVLFNTLFVSPEEIQAADQSGQLEAIAPPFDELNAAIAQSGSANPVLQEGARPTGMKMGGTQPSSAMPMPAGSPKPMPSGAQKTLASKRAANMQLGAPTSGPEPGQGRLLNALLKPVL